MQDVHVIGAGPSGSVAATCAVRKGYNVILSEEHTSAGKPVHCSGLFSKTGLESIKEFVDYRKLIINPMHGAIIDFAGEKIQIRTKDAIAYVCDRAGLDEAITTNAIREGVKVEFGKRVTGNYLANTVIGGDGPFSHVASTFKFPKINEYVSTIQAHVKYKSETPDMVEVFLSNEHFPGLFGWIIPHTEEVAEFGVGVTLPHHSSTKAWNALLKMKGVEYSGELGGAVIPITVRKKTAGTFGKKKVLLVGDAAGQVKSTTGGGVIFGANCARYAGSHCDNPLRYELEWKARFGMDLFAHRQVHNFIYSKRDEELRALGSRLKRMELDKFLSNHGHMDKPTKMIRPELLKHFMQAV
ncbi:MAG: NAD(P)/FAD-dependent oxidoreductase [Candidatus Micrarchaeota archaeon]|nr:NAD(P)/FAD-dependent oxidoreductase [Candidatus Micrarchaeota archaeon]